jgi:hypothetical protein
MNSTPPTLLTRRDYFAIEFALRLMHTKQVAPGKVAVPRKGGNDEPTMQIQCEFGVAIRMADDLCTALDAPQEAQPQVVEPPADAKNDTSN